MIFLKKKNYPLYKKKDKANGDDLKQVVFLSGESVDIQNKISSRKFAGTNTLRKSVGCGLHRSIGLLKRDDSNSPHLISDKNSSCATIGSGKLHGNFWMFLRVVLTRKKTGKNGPFFYGNFSDYFTVF